MNTEPSARPGESSLFQHGHGPDVGEYEGNDPRLGAVGPDHHMYETIQRAQASIQRGNIGVLWPALVVVGLLFLAKR